MLRRPEVRLLMTLSGWIASKRTTISKFIRMITESAVGPSYSSETRMPREKRGVPCSSASVVFLLTTVGKIILLSPTHSCKRDTDDMASTGCLVTFIIYLFSHLAHSCKIEVLHWVQLTSTALLPERSSSLAAVSAPHSASSSKVPKSTATVAREALTPGRALQSRS